MPATPAACRSRPRGPRRSTARHRAASTTPPAPSPWRCARPQCQVRLWGRPRVGARGVARSGGHMGPPLRLGGGDEGVEDLGVTGADRIFGVPLHAQAEAVFWVFDAFDDTVLGERVDYHAGSEILG